LDVLAAIGLRLLRFLTGWARNNTSAIEAKADIIQEKVDIKEFPLMTQSGQQIGCDRQKVGRRSATIVAQEPSNRGKTVQALHCSIRYGEYNGLKTGERIDFPIGRPPMAIQGVQKRHPGATEQLTLFGAAIIVLLIFAWSYVYP
jgi:hypothetical protein